MNILSNRIKQAFLLILDALILLFSLYMALTLRYFEYPGDALWQGHFMLFIPIFAIWLLTFYISNLYDFRKFINQSKLIEQISKSIFVAFLISIIFLYLIPNRELSPKTNLIIFSVISYIFILLWRLSFSLLNQKYLPNTNIGIIGYNEIIRKTIYLIKNNEQLGYDIKFILADNNHVMIEIAEHYGLNLIKDVNQLARSIKEHKINVLILEKDVGEMKELQKTLFNLLPTGINYCNLTSFYEEVSGQIPLEILNKGWFLENLNLANKRNFERVKRLYDLFFSFILLIIALPFCILIAIIIRLTSRGPAIFTQTRVGRGDKKFKFYKFRTMRVDNNNHAPTVKNDKRITRFGRFLRQTRLDELPQLFNVLRGDMSFAGPRPERPELIKELSGSIPFYGVRNLIKPGITGWDQISGEYHSPSVGDTYKKLQYDLFYIKNRSVSLDLSIILKTIRTAVSKEGR